jgi:hypothetical protein
MQPAPGLQSAGMAPFQTRWTREQRQAIVDACTRYEMTTTAACAAAHEGSLPGAGQDLEPFPIPLATVREYATKARREIRLLEAAKAHPEELFEQEARQLVSAWKRTREAMTRKRATLTPAQVTELAKAGLEVQKFIRALNQNPRRNGAQRAVETPQTAGEQDGEPDFLDVLASTKHGRQ